MDLLSFENSVLCLDIKPVGPVFGLPGTLMRRQSVQRAATVNNRKKVCQVIIKDTFSLKENGESPLKKAGTLNRSRSLMSTNHVPFLAPRRGDRQRIEQKMSEVWTKDRLPYPGMTGHKGSHLIRTSATSVMRKISLASTITATGSTKRRTLTHGSPVDNRLDWTKTSNPLGHQTDGAASPTFENTHPHPDTFWSTLEYQDPNPYAERVSSTSEEVSLNEANIEHLVSDENEGKSRQASDASTIVATRHPKVLGLEKGKPRKPKTILKAFSTESIRGWFHSGAR